jgi:uncharacterized protein YbbK (DUF523 family)
MRREIPEEGLVLVSACLAGLATTHDGKAKPHPRVLELLRQGRAVLVCPEQLGGLPTPRPEAEIQPGATGGDVLQSEAKVIDVNGSDVTAQYKRGANEALKAARLSGARSAILKARSPSCGSGQIYDGTFAGKLVEGEGVTAALLKLQGLEVLTEEDL